MQVQITEDEDEEMVLVLLPGCDPSAPVPVTVSSTNVLYPSGPLLLLVFLKAFLQRYPVPRAQRRNLIVRGARCWFKKYFAQPRLSSVSGWTVQSARGFPGKPSSFKTSLNGTKLGGWCRFLGVCQGGAPISSGEIGPCNVSPNWTA